MAHPYMANSVERLVEEMLAETGAGSVEELFTQVPAEHRLRRPLELPPALTSEAALERHLSELLDRNLSAADALSFLGAGTYRHYVPAICDEVAGRWEWATSVWGSPSSDHGRFQAWFEFQSQLGELLELDFVGLPVYSWGCAAGHALRMAARMTGRRRVIVSTAVDPERAAVIASYCGRRELERHLELERVGYDPARGTTDLAALLPRLGGDVAAVYLESPNVFGVIEDGVAELAAVAASAGVEVVLGSDPISLGVLAPPGQLGVGLAVGTIQTLGVHPNAGGGVGGFIASRDEERYAREYPTLQVSLCPTSQPGERGFGMALFEQSSYGAREQGKDWTGNSVYMWAIAATTYMAVMGPAGFEELGEAVLQRSHDAAARLAEIPGVAVRFPTGFFREVVVDFSGTNRSVAEIDAALREQRIIGGLDLSRRFPELGQSALYCFTEQHSAEDVDRLAGALWKVVQ